MTIKFLIDTLDEFRDEYNTSLDPEVKKLCGFITNTIDNLVRYDHFFLHARDQIEKSQEFYEGALETLNELLDGDVDDTGNLPDSLPDGGLPEVTP